MRLALLLLLALPARPAGAPDVETFYERLGRFDQRYERMLHRACGWPERLAQLEETCRPAEGRVDAKEFAEAREAAKKLFDLEEKR